MLAKERNTEVLALTPDKDLGPSSNCRGIPRTPRNSNGDMTCLRPQEGVLEVTVVTQVEPQFSCQNTRKSSRFSPQCEMRTFYAAVSREQSHLPILGHPLLLLTPIPPSIRIFSNESTLRMRRPKYWSFSFSIIPSKEIPGLIFIFFFFAFIHFIFFFLRFKMFYFRMDWLDLPAFQGTLKSLLQHHTSKA